MNTSATMNNIASILVERMKEADSDLLFYGSSESVIPFNTGSDYCLYPDFAILVVKKDDLDALSLGKRVHLVEFIDSLFFYDDRVMFFQHYCHVGHIGFVNFTEADIRKADIGPRAEKFTRGLFEMFGDLSNNVNYNMYRSRYNLRDDYKFISMMDAENLIDMNNRILAIIDVDGTIRICRVKSDRKR